jgi:hypothetical protein
VPAVVADVFEWTEGAKVELELRWPARVAERRRAGRSPFPDFREASNLDDESLATVRIHSGAADFSSSAGDFDELVAADAGAAAVALPMRLLAAEGLPEVDRAEYWVLGLELGAVRSVEVVWPRGGISATWSAL